MTDRKNKPRAKDGKGGKEKEPYIEDDVEHTSAEENTLTKKPAPSASLITPKSETSSAKKSSISKLIIDTAEPNDAFAENAVKQDELHQALGTIKRKQNDDGLLILNEKVKILKLAKDLTGATSPATTSSEFNFRLSKISKILSFYTPDKLEEKIPDS